MWFNQKNIFEKVEKVTLISLVSVDSLEILEAKNIFARRSGREQVAQTAEIVELSNRLPTHAEIASAAEAAEAIARACLVNGGKLDLGTADGREVHLSPSICTLLTDVLQHIAQGEMVTVVGTGALLTTQEAADILNVSRPYVSKLLKNGKIPFTQVGAHRRIKMDDLLEYRASREQKIDKALDEIAAIGEELGI